MNYWIGKNETVSLTGDPRDLDAALARAYIAVSKSDLESKPMIDLEGNVLFHADPIMVDAFKTAVVKAREVLGGPEADGWREAISDEVRTLKEDKEIAIECDRNEVGPDDVLVPAQLILESKVEDGVEIRKKARIVICGNHLPTEQSLYSAVVTEVWVPLVVTMMSQGWHLATVDVSTAFLQTDKDICRKRQYNVYVRIPRYSNGTVGPARKDKVWRIDGSLYGMNSASKDWKETLDKWLVEVGFRQSLYDSSSLSVRT